MPDTFVHLHVASGYSMQYGASTPAALVERAAAWGQPALALTDTNNLFGALDLACASTRALRLVSSIHRSLYTLISR